MSAKRVQSSSGPSGLRNDVDARVQHEVDASLRNLRERLAANAHHRAQAYTWQSVADRILNLYAELWPKR